MSTTACKNICKQFKHMLELFGMVWKNGETSANVLNLSDSMFQKSPKRLQTLSFWTCCILWDWDWDHECGVATAPAQLST